MKNLFSILFSVGALAAGAAVPQVSAVSVSQNPSSLLVTVGYTLDSEAIVTAKVFTNGVQVAAKDLPFFGGDVSRVVQAGARSFTWLPPPGLEGFVLDDTVRVELTAWPKETPPDYLVVDLRNGDGRYYPREDDLPAGGIAADVYRKDLIVLRHIHAAGASFMMGSGANEWGRIVNVGNNCNEDRHEVRFTHDFWCGVFELTQYQAARCSDEMWYGSAFSNETFRATRPAERLSYNDFRGDKWPTDGFEGARGMIAKLRQATGRRFDLLTEAQWEFACRAGTTTSLNSGIDMSATPATAGDDDMGADGALDVLGRYNANGGRNADKSKADTAISDTTRGTARVGSYRPNAWGLYDMHGNVSEFVLDWANWKDGNFGGLGSAPQTDPVGPTKTACESHAGWVQARVTKGGSWQFAARYARSAAKRYQAAAGGLAFGFRLAIQEY